ncbi:TPR-like protein [Imleria badia]|nr:TPR-like protein [Imleria badia]
MLAATTNHSNHGLNRNGLVVRPVSHIGRPATSALQLSAGRRVGPVHVDGQLLGEQDSASLLTIEDPQILSGRLLNRFHRFGDLADLQQAIAILEKLVKSSSVVDERYGAALGDLGPALQFRFERLGELSDLEGAISMLRDAVDLAPQGHPHKSGLLNNLGNSFKARFDRLGELSDLEEAISRHKDAVDLTPDGHIHKPGHLNNLGISLRARFDRLGQLTDLEDAISTLRIAVDLTPPGHPYKSGHLNNLGDAFKARFERLGQLSDLEDAISTLRNAVDLTPEGHPHKPNLLNNLGGSFKVRFYRLGDQSDLEEAISRHQDAVDLIPHGHVQKPGILSNLGDSFKTRFDLLGELGDLDDAISTLRDAVNLTPHGHVHKPGHLNNLGGSFKARFDRLGQLRDLDDAISTHRDAVNLTPHGHPFKPSHLANLGNSSFTRFQRLEQLSDLEETISRYNDAVDLTPADHPSKPNYLYALGNFFLARFRVLGELSNIEQAISLYFYAASAPIGPVRVRFDAAQQWISCALHIRHHSLLHAYSIAISLLPQLAWIGFSLARRYSELAQGADVVREAAAAALDAGLPETAVEWLEQGRSIVWGELFQLRSSYQELSSAHPDHARRLRELSAALEHASSTREISESTSKEQTPTAAPHATGSLQEDADRHRTLAIERDKLLQEIRGFPGFKQFLLRKEFSHLRASAHSGPVVILNAAESRCDALIILADVDHAIHVPLPNFTFQRSTGLQNMLERLLGHARVIRYDEREGEPAILRSVSWESLLSTLWNDVVKPVLDVLAFSTPEDLSRIFWCPTGPFVFLPIHAAGLYGIQHSQHGHKVSDFVISSYVPTLSILALSPNPDVAPSGDLRLLAVGQPPSDGLSPLPGVTTELEHIRAVIGDSPSAQTTLLESSVGTVEEVISLMKEADWVHFACHGIQDAADSGLCLADRRRLKLRDIVALSRPHGGFAFLSACQTAMGDEHLSDEAIHIAAGMLFAGYGGVVGTMWSISDKLAPRLARDVYEQLFRNSTRPDYRGAARALHDAVGRLRDSGQASFVTWLPFIHVGL